MVSQYAWEFQVEMMAWMHYPVCMCECVFEREREGGERDQGKISQWILLKAQLKIWYYYDFLSTNYTTTTLSGIPAIQFWYIMKMDSYITPDLLQDVQQLTAQPQSAAGNLTKLSILLHLAAAPFLGGLILSLTSPFTTWHYLNTVYW